MLQTTALSGSGILSFQQLTESQNRIERSAQLVTHAGKKFALCPIRAVGLIPGLLERLLYLRALGHIVCNCEKCSSALRPGGRPEDINGRAVLANVAVNKIRYFTSLLQRGFSRKCSVAVFRRDKVDVFAPDEFGPGVAPELFARSVEGYKPAFLIHCANDIERVIHD